MRAPCFLKIIAGFAPLLARRNSYFIAVRACSLLICVPLILLHLCPYSVKTSHPPPSANLLLSFTIKSTSSCVPGTVG